MSLNLNTHAGTISRLRFAVKPELSHMAGVLLDSLRGQVHCLGVRGCRGRGLTAWLVLLLLGLVGAACGPTAIVGPTDTATATATAKPVRTPTPTSTPTPGTAVNLYAARRAQFIVDWSYETLVDLDRQAGPNRAYNDGVLTCELVLQGSLPGNIPAVLMKRSSWTGSGAEAVVAAAVLSVCPEAGARYLTQFDQEVAAARLGIQAESGINPPEVATGETAKLVCDYLTKRGSSLHLWDLLQSNGTPGNAPMKVVARNVVATHCLFFNNYLGPWWYNNAPGPPTG